jgi:glycosyltransferase involved in cell wall biosynthesis
MSDLWLVAGAEHVTDTRRYVNGYSRGSRPAGESGPDINRETFHRKKRNWRKKSWIVALSKWQARQAELSDLTKKWPVTVIPVPIDPEIWYPIEQKEAREKLGLPQGSLLIGFGAGEATRHRHKGADLLFSALEAGDFQDFQSKEYGSVELVIFGEEKDTSQHTPISTHFLGKLSNEQLRWAYSALDVLVVPSRQEPFGQVAAEAQTCGAPVVVFDNSGLADVVEDFVTGRIVPAFDTSALGEAIAWVLKDQQRQTELKKAARDRAMRLWHPRVVAEQYAKVLIKAATSVRRIQSR